MTPSVLVVFVPPPSGLPGGVLLRAQMAALRVLGKVEITRYVLKGSFQTRNEALRRALGVAKALNPEVGRATVVCSAGDDDRGWRLAIGLDRDLVPHAIEVLASPGFMDGFSVPPGVGAFRAPGHGHGNEAHVLVDYR